MKSDDPIRHHIVPVLLLKRFTNEDGRLFACRKESAKREIFAAAPEELFFEKHGYATTRKDGTRDVSLERTYSQLESLTEPVVEKIVSSARAGQKPQLTPDEREIWDLFFCNQWKRTPDFYKKIGMTETIESRIKRITAEFEATVRPLTADEARNLNDPQSQARIARNARIDALASPSPGILDGLRRKGLGIVVIKNPKKSFAIGSFPVVKLTRPGRTNLSDPSVEVWLPIAYDVAVSPAPIQPRMEMLVPIQDDSMIRRINTAMWKNSSTIAGRSKELVASLAHQR